MTIAWAPVVAALDAAVATASQVDRAAIRTARAELARLGAAYNAAVADGTIVPVTGATAEAVAAERLRLALADLDRATARLEALPVVRLALAEAEGVTRSAWSGAILSSSPRAALSGVPRAERALSVAQRAASSPTTDRADFDLRVERVRAHLAAVKAAQRPASSPDVERQLIAAMDAAARLLAYLSA